MAANLPEVKAYESIRDEVKTSHYENKSYEQSCKIKDNLIKKYYLKYKNIVSENSKLSSNLNKLESNTLEQRRTLQSLQKITGVGENAIYDLKRASLEINERKKKLQNASDATIKKYKEKSVQHHFACENKKLPMERKMLQNKIKVYEFKHRKNEADYEYIISCIKTFNNICAEKAKNAIVDFSQHMVSYKNKIVQLKKLREGIKEERVAHYQLGNKKMEIFQQIQKFKNDRHISVDGHLSEKMGKMLPVLKLKYHNEIPILHLPSSQNVKKCDGENVFKKPLPPTHCDPPQENVSKSQVMKASYASKLKEISERHEKLDKNIFSLTNFLKMPQNKSQIELSKEPNETTLQNQNITDKQLNDGVVHENSIKILENVKMSKEESAKMLGDIKKNAPVHMQLQPKDVIIDMAKFKKHEQMISKQSSVYENDVEMKNSTKDETDTLVKDAEGLAKLQEPSYQPDYGKSLHNAGHLPRKVSQDNLNENVSQASQAGSEDVIASMQQQFYKYQSIQSPEFVFEANKRFAMKQDENINNDETSVKAGAEKKNENEEQRKNHAEQQISNMEVEPAEKKLKLEVTPIIDNTKICEQSVDEDDAPQSSNRECKNTLPDEKDAMTMSLNQSVVDTSTQKEYTSSYFLSKINELRSVDYETTMDSDYGEDASLQSYTQTLNEGASFLMSPKADQPQPKEKDENMEKAKTESNFLFQYEVGAVDNSPFQLFGNTSTKPSTDADKESDKNQTGGFSFLFNKNDKAKSSFFNLFN